MNATWSRRLRYATTGIVAAVAGAGIGHLVAGFSYPPGSPVYVLGSTVIDLTPTPLKEWAIQAFGTADKPILLSIIGLVTIGLAAMCGVIARTRRKLGLWLLAGLSFSGAIAAWVRVDSAAVDALPSVVAMVAGVFTMAKLLKLADQWPEPVVPVVPSAEPSEPAEPDEPAHESPTDHNAYGTGESWKTGRRGFIVAAAGATATAAAATALGTAMTRPIGSVAADELPVPAEPLPPLPQGLESEISGISSFRTPNSQFYRVDTVFAVPRIDPQSWTLTVDGDVASKVQISWKELLAMPMIEKDITLNCVSNEVGGQYVGAARWLGVPVRKILEQAKPNPTADQILSTSDDGMTISTPIQALMDDRDALLAIAMNGKPLPPKHGAPVRLVTPGLYGFVGSTKWVTTLTATTYDAQPAYWTDRGWATDAPIITQTRIDTPKTLKTQKPGTVAIGGVAWAQGRGIVKVEVQIDEGPWHEATLGPDAGIDYWRQWFYLWDAPTGRHTVTARAVDGTGATQPEARAPAFPSGASGYHRIVSIIS